jgi:opacity protein-like surface antigen
MPPFERQEGVMRWLVVVAALALATGVEAKTPIYFGGAFTSLTLEDPTANIYGNTVGGYGLVGADLTKWLAIEARFGSSERSDRYLTFPVTVPGQIPITTHTQAVAENYFTGLVKARFVSSGWLTLYGLLGGTSVRYRDLVEQSTPAPNVQLFALRSKKTSFGLSTGAGVEGKISDRWSIRGEYLRMWDDIELDGFNTARISSYSVAAIYHL